MIYTNKIKKAIKFAIETHEINQKQKRKGKDIAYITHPFTVGLILAKAGADENVVVAGILHDTIEDSIKEKKVNKEQIQELFGEEVAEIVGNVTEENKEMSWEDRKKEAREHLKTMPLNSLLVKTADVISNTNEILEDFSDVGFEVFDRFNASKLNVLYHYILTIKIIRERWQDNPFRSDLGKINIELLRLEALLRGSIAYTEWNIYFIEYEMQTEYPFSPSREKIEKLCGDFHIIVNQYEKDFSISNFLSESRIIVNLFRELISQIEEKEEGVDLLLKMHIVDISYSLKQITDES